MNPLRGILADLIDFERLASSPIKLFVTATNVRTGRGRVFRNAEITPDVLLASACLPTMFHAVEIDGDPYWDGGYAGNPTMTPLIRECQSSDTILVQINPVERPGVPRSAQRDQQPPQRDLVQLAAAEGAAHDRHAAPGGRPRPRRGRGLGAACASTASPRDAMLELGYSSKMIAEWAFLCKLRDEGRRAASAFLDAHAGDIGKRSTLDLDALLEGV